MPQSWDCINPNGSPGYINAEIQNPEEEFAYFPNPVTELLYFKGLDENSSFEIHDVSGKFLFERIITDKVYLGTLEPGLFLVTVTRNGEPFSFKIIKH